MPLIPALRRQRQVDLCEFEASLVYEASSRTVRAVTQRNPDSQQKQQQRVFSEKGILESAMIIRDGGAQAQRLADLKA